MITAALCIIVGWILGAITVLVMGALAASNAGDRREHEKAQRQYIEILERQLTERWSEEGGNE